jgi:hypothetical protein
MSRKTNITARDNFIIAKALAYAIEIIESLPQERQEQSDKEDMKRLLRTHSATTRLLARHSARLHLFQETRDMFFKAFGLDPLKSVPNTACEG